MGRMTSWTGLFGSRSPKRKPDPRIRWFGKLPTYADYYSSGIDEDWVVEFNDWILEGFEGYLRSSRAARGGSGSAGRSFAQHLPVAGLIVRLPKSGMTVLGGMQDYGGDMVGRPFPLCFYAAVPTAQWTGPTSGHLAGATRVVQDLMGLHDEVVRFLNAPGEFKSWFDDRQIDLAGVDGHTRDDSWVDAASRIPLADWFNATGEELAPTDLDAWLGRVARWGEGIAALESKSFEPTLSFPLAHGIELHVQTAGWVRWLESRMDLKRRTLSLMMTGAPAAAARRLVVIAHDLAAQDFLLLTPLAGGLRHVDDLSRAEDSVQSARADAPKCSPVAEPALTASWADFVQAEPKPA